MVSETTTDYDYDDSLLDESFENEDELDMDFDLPEESIKDPFAERILQSFAVRKTETEDEE